jgi:hypothetical protein
MKTDHDLAKADIILESRKTDNTYYLFSDMIVIKGEHEDVIELPGKNEILCFCDMYYELDELHIFAATTRSYDAMYVLDEYDLTITRKGYRK